MMRHEQESARQRDEIACSKLVQDPDAEEKEHGGNSVGLERREQQGRESELR